MSCTGLKVLSTGLYRMYRALPDHAHMEEKQYGDLFHHFSCTGQDWSALHGEDASCLSTASVKRSGELATTSEAQTKPEPRRHGRPPPKPPNENVTTLCGGYLSPGYSPGYFPVLTRILIQLDNQREKFYLRLLWRTMPRSDLHAPGWILFVDGLICGGSVDPLQDSMERMTFQQVMLV